MKNLTKKLIASFCLVSIFSLSFVGFPPKKAEAQFGGPAFEINPAVLVPLSISASADVSGVYVKDFGLDTLAFILANILLERLAASTVNWINTGFNGSPSFVSNPEQYFGNLADGIVGQLLYSNPNFKSMCAPFSAKVRVAINNSYRNQNQFQCTLSSVIGNFDNFIGDFNQGGWDGFIQLTQNSQNNPIGLYNTWQDEINLSIATAQDRKEKELQQGSGFLSYKKCTPAITNSANDDSHGQEYYLDDLGNKHYIENPVDDVGTPNYASEAQYAQYNCTTETPGAVIQNQLNQVLGSGTDRLKVADEINEIISALLNQLVSKALGGLASLGKRDPANDNQSFISQLENASANDPDTQKAVSGATTFINQGNTTLSNLKDDPTCYPTTSAGEIPARCIGPNGSGGNNSGGSGSSGGNTGFVPITASDNSVIYGPPSDPECQLASFDDIVHRAGQIYYAGQGGGQNIAQIVQNMDCGPGGALP